MSGGVISIKKINLQIMKKSMKIHCTLALCFLLNMIITTSLLAQNDAELRKIAASQAGASSLLFAPNGSKIPEVNPGSFYFEQECTVRNGIPNFLDKIKCGKELTVAFIGGSITQGMYCYRLQTAKYLQGLYLNTKFKWINAGVSGTGTDLAAFRLDEQVLKYKPDLIFIEFAVNGAYQPGMEGIIRKIINNNPQTDICLIYTILNGQTAIYQKGDIPSNIFGLEQLAAHYQLPSIHLGMEAALLEQQQKLAWKGPAAGAGDKILFSTDGIHPLLEGGNLYAMAIARGFKKMEALNKPLNHPLPKPLVGDEWQNANMYEPSSIASFDDNWKRINTSASALKSFSSWFDDIMTADKAGASFSFTFEGDIFGIFDIGGPEVGQLEVFVDGKQVYLKSVNEKGLRMYEASPAQGAKELNRFNAYCNNRYRGQHDMIKLTPGTHKVIVKIAKEQVDKRTILGKSQQDDISKNPEKYKQTVVYLGRILLRGKPISK